MSNMNAGAYRVWRLTNGQAKIEEVIIAKKTPSYVWTASPGEEQVKLTSENKFNTNGHSKYSREPCLERLFFFKSEAIAYAAELDKNPKPYN